MLDTMCTPLKAEAVPAQSKEKQFGSIFHGASIVGLQSNTAVYS